MTRKKSLKLISLSVITALAGLGALSLVINSRDFAFYLATNMMSYQRQIRELEVEAGQRSKFNEEQRKKNDSLRRRSDSLSWQVQALEKKIEDHKLSFKREVDIRLNGFENEVIVTRTWERGSSLVRKDLRFADLVIHDFVDITRDNTFPDSLLGFKHAGSPWYIDQLLTLLHSTGQIIDGQSVNCFEVPRHMKTWTNPYQILITKVEKQVLCDGVYYGKKFPEYWLGTADDSSPWIISLKPETGYLAKLGLDGRYVDKVVASLALRSYYLE